MIPVSVFPFLPSQLFSPPQLPLSPISLPLPVFSSHPLFDLGGSEASENGLVSAGGLVLALVGLMLALLGLVLALMGLMLDLVLALLGLVLASAEMRAPLTMLEASLVGLCHLQTLCAWEDPSLLIYCRSHY